MFVYLIGIISACITLLLGRFLIEVMVRRARHHPAAPRQPQEAAALPTRIGEKRVSVRHTGPPLKVLISDAKATKKPVAGLIMNRSIGGLCILVPEKVVEKTMLSVRAVDAPADVPWVQVEVRRCETRGIRYEFGCRFVSAQSASVLHLFG